MNQVGPRGENIHILSGQGFSHKSTMTFLTLDLIIWFNVTAYLLPKVTLGVIRARFGRVERQLERIFAVHLQTEL